MSVTKNEMAKIIVDAAIEVHRAGWLELVIHLGERQVRQGIPFISFVTGTIPSIFIAMSTASAESARSASSRRVILDFRMLN